MHYAHYVVPNVNSDNRRDFANFDFRGRIDFQNGFFHRFGKLRAIAMHNADFFPFRLFGVRGIQADQLVQSEFQADFLADADKLAVLADAQQRFDVQHFSECRQTCRNAPAPF